MGRRSSPIDEAQDSGGNQRDRGVAWCLDQIATSFWASIPELPRVRSSYELTAALEHQHQHSQARREEPARGADQVRGHLASLGSEEKRERRCSGQRG